MDKEEFIEELGLPFDWEERGSEYVINLNNSDSFSKAYDLISNNRDLTLEDDSITTTDNALFTFFTDLFEIRLVADFNKDIYKVILGDR